MTLNEKIFQCRKRSGLSQEELAERLGVSRQAVSKWESGKGYPEVEKLLFICRQYHVTLNDLFENTTFCEISAAGLRESHVHDVIITKEAPNYRIDN